MDLSVSRSPPSPKVVKAICAVAKRANEYPESMSDELRNALATYNKIKPEDILVGNGSDEIIDLVSRAFLGTRGRTIIPIPTFSQYEKSARLLLAHVSKTLFLVDGEYDFQPERVLRKVDSRTRLIWICNPNNPTGTSISQDRIKHILDHVDSGVYVAVDECYFEFSGNTAADLVKDFSNLIIVRSLSKTFSLAGLRVGYAISDPETIKNVWSFRQPFNVNLMAQVAGVAALSSLAYYKRMWRKISLERERLAKGLGDIDGVATLPSATNFLLLNLIKCRRNPIGVYDALLRRKISVLPGWSDEFTGLDKHYMRVLVGRREENERFLAELRRVIF